MHLLSCPVVGLVGCGSATGPEPPLGVTVAVSRREVLPGDTLSIIVTATNRTDKEIVLPQGPCTPLIYRVYTPSGERIAPPVELFCGTTGDPTLRVPSRESRSVVHRWSAIYNYHQPGPAQPLAPGAYQVVGGLAGEPDLEVQSVPAMVRVRAP